MTRTKSTFLALLATFWAVSASADVIIYGYEDGSDVIFSGGGSLDLTGLGAPGGPQDFTGVILGRVQADEPELLFLDANVDVYLEAATVVADPFGPGFITDADVVSGDAFGFEGSILVTPFGYASGDLLSASMSFLGESFSTMGLIAGTYVWSLPNDSFTVIIGERPVPVPEPGTLALLGIGLLGMGAARRRKKV